jgi:hypothetical protein
MSLKPPALWIEQRGRQHRVYSRNTPGLGLPVRSYQRGLCCSPARCLSWSGAVGRR